MHSPIKVSVVLITYNQKEYVRETLNSILMQETDFPVEVLVSDDASSDGTDEVLSDIQKNSSGRISLFLRKKNVGGTRNAYGILKRAKGEYIASLEGDDIWSDRHFLERAVKFLDERKEYIGVQDKCRIIDKDSNVIDAEEFLKGKDFWKYDNDTYSIKEYCQWKMPGHISALVYRNIFRDDPKKMSILYKMHPMVGDRTILMELVSRGTIYCTNHISLDYRLNISLGSTNWMSHQHEKNRRYEEYVHICRIDRYMKKHYDIRYSLAALKRSKIAAAAIVYMNDKSLENYEALKNIVLYQKRAVLDVSIAVFAIVQKKMWIAIGKPEHRVWI